MRRAIREYGVRAPADDVPGWPWPLEVRMLGRFEVLRDGQPLAFSRKAAEEDAGVAEGDGRAGRTRGFRAAPARRTVAGRGGRCRRARARCDASCACAGCSASRRDRAAGRQAELRIRSASGSTCSLSNRQSFRPMTSRDAPVEAGASSRAPSSCTREASWPRTAGKPGPWPRASACAAASSTPWVATPNGWKPTATMRVPSAPICAAWMPTRRWKSFYQGLMRCYQRPGPAQRRDQRVSAAPAGAVGHAGPDPSSSSERLYQALREQAALTSDRSSAPDLRLSLGPRGQGLTSGSRCPAAPAGRRDRFRKK